MELGEDGAQPLRSFDRAVSIKVVNVHEICIKKFKFVMNFKNEFLDNTHEF